MKDSEKRLEKTCVLADGLKRAGFNVEVLLCKDGIPCLHAYKKPRTSDLENIPRAKREGERV